MGKLFGTDGIRGTYGEYPLIPEFIVRLGQATGKVLSEKHNKPVVIIGMDTRVSSEIIKGALVTGLLSSGIDVIDVGVMTTPGVSWLTNNYKLSGGIVISASHNPYEQNGIKYFSENGEKLEDNEEERIENLTLSNKSIRVAINPGKLIHNSSLQREYITSLINEHKQLNLRDFKIVVDCANGAASPYAVELLTKLRSNVFAVNSSPNGININYQAGSEYVRRHNAEIGKIIEIKKSDLGIAFDGDADRVIFVDEQGNVVDGDAIIGLLAIHLKNNNKLLSNSVAVTVMRNLGLKRFLLDNQIGVIETPVGDKYIYQALKTIKEKTNEDHKLGLGGEQSGHVIIFDDNHKTGDGLRTALYVLEAYIESGKRKFSEFVTNLGRTPQIIASAYVGSGSRLSKEELEAMKDQFIKTHKGIVEINLRYSGTEPLFRAMLQSDGNLSEIDLASIAKEICINVQKVANSDGSEIDILNCTSGGIL